MLTTFSLPTRIFWVEASALSSFRSSQGLRTRLVDVQQIYDEFGYGISGAAPIKDFLTYAYEHWLPPAPSYVLLVGDGHYDPKDYSGIGRLSYIPPYLAMVDPGLGETAADNRYVSLVGEDNLPEMMLGRLAVNSSAEASAFINKIIAYEQSPINGDWQRQVLAVASASDLGGDFPKILDLTLAQTVPEPFQATKIYYGLTHVNLAEAITALKNGINEGQIVC